MTTGTDARVGTTLAGYRLERLLGRGGMSVVYLAEDLRLGRRVALKLLAPELAADDRFRERFLRESRVAASLDHSNVIPVYEAGEADGLLYIAMRYVEGTELKTLLEREGALAPRRALDLVGQAADALDLAHARGLVHRDVKPANILLAAEDGRGVEHVYLSDFGLTKQASSESGLTEAGQFVGTAEYIAPEQIEHGDVGPRSDVYSLACVLFESLTGASPFRRTSLLALLWAHVHDPPPSASALRPELPAAIDAVLARGLAKRAGDRYGSCGAMVAAARTALSLAELAPSRAHRLALRPGLALVVLAAAAALAAVAIGVALALRDDGAGGPTLAPKVDSLQRIDPASGRLVATVPLGSTVGRLTAGPGGIWALDRAGGYWRVDPASNEVAASGSISGEPAAAVAAHDAVWIAHREGATARSATITQVDPSSGRASRAVPVAVAQLVPNESMLSGIAAGDRETRPPALWLTSPFELSVLRIRPRLGSVVAKVRVGETAPRHLAAGAGAVWIARAYAVVRVDPVRNAVAATIRLPFSPRDVAVGAGAVWVVNGTGDAVWVIDPAANRVVDRIPVGREPVAVAVGRSGVWVANRGDGTVTKIDSGRGLAVATVDVGGRPEDVAVGAGGVWVAVHGRPGGEDGRLSDDEYLELMNATVTRSDRLWTDAFQPVALAFATQSLTGFENAPPEAALEMTAVARLGLAEIRAFEPPERFAADHRHFVAGLARLAEHYQGLADGIAANDTDVIRDAFNAMNTEIVRIRVGLSDEFKEHVRTFPLVA